MEGLDLSKLIDELEGGGNFCYYSMNIQGTLVDYTEQGLSSEFDQLAMSIVYLIIKLLNVSSSHLGSYVLDRLKKLNESFDIKDQVKGITPKLENAIRAVTEYSSMEHQLLTLRSISGVITFEDIRSVYDSIAIEITQINSSIVEVTTAIKSSKFYQKMKNYELDTISGLRARIGILEEENAKLRNHIETIG